MGHFCAYDTTDTLAGELALIGEVSGAIGASGKGIFNIKSPTSVQLPSETYLKVEKEWLYVRRISGATSGSGTTSLGGFVIALGAGGVSLGSTWEIIARAQKGSSAAAHAEGKKVYWPTNMGYYLPIEAKEIVNLGVIQTDKAEKITGSVNSSSSGELLVEQAFDLPNEYTAETLQTFDIAEKIAITGGKAATFSVNVLAPRARIRFESTSEIKTTEELRIFARTTYQQGK